MNKVVELFGRNTRKKGAKWLKIISAQGCPFLGKRCYKVRKSDPDISIGSCTVLYGAANAEPIIICPTRLIERGQIFTDCLHLLTRQNAGKFVTLLALNFRLWTRLARCGPKGSDWLKNLVFRDQISPRRAQKRSG